MQSQQQNIQQYSALSEALHQSLAYLANSEASLKAEQDNLKRFSVELHELYVDTQNKLEVLNRRIDVSSVQEQDASIQELQNAVEQLQQTVSELHSENQSLRELVSKSAEKRDVEATFNNFLSVYNRDKSKQTNCLDKLNKTVSSLQQEMKAANEQICEQRKSTETINAAFSSFRDKQTERHKQYDDKLEEQKQQSEELCKRIDHLHDYCKHLKAEIIYSRDDMRERLGGLEGIVNVLDKKQIDHAAEVNSLIETLQNQIQNLQSGSADETGHTLSDADLKAQFEDIYCIYNDLEKLNSNVSKLQQEQLASSEQISAQHKLADTINAAFCSFRDKQTERRKQYDSKLEEQNQQSKELCKRIDHLNDYCKNLEARIINSRDDLCDLFSALKDTVNVLEMQQHDHASEVNSLVEILQNQIQNLQSGSAGEAVQTTSEANSTANLECLNHKLELSREDTIWFQGRLDEFTKTLDDKLQSFSADKSGLSVSEEKLSALINSRLDEITSQFIAFDGESRSLLSEIKKGLRLNGLLGNPELAVTFSKALQPMPAPTDFMAADSQISDFLKMFDLFEKRWESSSLNPPTRQNLSRQKTEVCIWLQSLRKCSGEADILCQRLRERLLYASVNEETQKEGGLSFKIAVSKLLYSILACSKGADKDKDLQIIKNFLTGPNGTIICRGMGIELIVPKKAQRFDKDCMTYSEYEQTPNDRADLHHTVIECQIPGIAWSLADNTREIIYKSKVKLFI